MRKLMAAVNWWFISSRKGVSKSLYLNIRSTLPNISYNRHLHSYYTKENHLTYWTFLFLSRYLLQTIKRMIHFHMKILLITFQHNIQYFPLTHQRQSHWALNIFRTYYSPCSSSHVFGCTLSCPPDAAPGEQQNKNKGWHLGHWQTSPPWNR